ncbi:MAG TPA: putative Ig domain-containing protein, partial [Acidimicrobiales bacterium]|nr:putative Ig domain-containing protein [Acidimicrobiales bacterium]
YWIITVTSGANFAEATAQTLPTGATPSAAVAPASNQTVTITFALVSSNGGTALTAYNVNRYAAGSVTHVAISGGCSVVASVVTCTDVPGSGTWQYSDTPAIASWVGIEGAKSTAVIVQAVTTSSVAATASVTVNTAVSPSATLSSATTSPAPGGSISFSVFGPQASAPSTCTGAGWSAVGSAVTVTANGSYGSSTSFTPSAAGTYWWYASYSGDTYNTASNSGCATTSTVVQLAMSPSSLPAATVYAAYSQTISASGGTSPYTFAVTSGTLPAGLTLSSAGVLSGTDTSAGQPGTFTFTVTATDHAGLTGTMTYGLTVNAPPITLSALTNPVDETAYTPSITASGGQATYTYAKTSGTLPTGLSLSSAGAFSGTTTASGTFVFTVMATDAHSYTGSQSYSLTPVAPTLTISPSSLPAATVYTAYSQTLNTSGGISAYTYSETGSLPTGITLSSAGAFSGTISAAAQSGSYPITVTSTDADSFTGTTSYTLTVNAPTIALSALTDPTGEATYTQSITASGGQATYTYAKTSGTLPTGLSLSTAGVLSGTSSAAGTFVFTVTATDVHGYTGTRSYTLTPAAPTFTVTPSSLPAATVYTAYSQTLSTSGGISAFSYSETGTLPTGISLSSAGVLSGTISAAGQAGSFPITVTSTDADGYAGTKSYTLTVNAPTITLTPTSLPNGTLGYSQQITATATGNATDTFTYAVTSGALPPGFTISTSGLITSGVSLALGNYTFTVTATDAHGYTGSRSYTIAILL